jgi:putative DNA primase/helicase
MNLQDSKLNTAIRFGLLVDNIKQDEQLHRVATQLKPKGKNGWYIAYDSLLIMGDWQTGLTELFKPNGHQQTHQDKQRIKQSIERHRQEKKALQRLTATYASQTYQNASEAIIHPYLTFKGLGNADGLKMVKDQLLVPLLDITTGKIENLQRIYSDGTKRFLKNGRITGLCCPCGLLNMQSEWPEQLTKVFICEGYATAASVYKMTSQPVLASMNSGNLLPVGKAVKAKWPNAEIVFAGDDDYLTEQKTGINTGRVKALEAATAIGAKVSFPPFTPEHKRAMLTDWNDYYLAISREVA